MRDEHPNFEALLDSTPGAYLILTPTFEIIAVSDNYLTATMTKREDILGRGIFEVFPDNPLDPEATGVSNLRASLERVLKNKTSDSMAIQKYDIKGPGGQFEVRCWSPINTPVLTSKNEVTYIIHCVEDVTAAVQQKQERLSQTVELQSQVDQTEKIRQAQRMEAMGKLAGGIAHDFNNMLAVIIMNCEVSLEQKDLSPLAVKSFNQIKSTADKAAKLTAQLLAFSRKQVFQPKVICINTVIKDLEEILKRLINEGIEIEFVLDKNLGNILADPTQIEQILINLVVNARDALPDGGRVTIETKNADLDVLLAKGNPSVNPGPYVMLSVRDTGVGMDANTQARIFEPFFTTKDVGKGTGLGLATIYGIVSQNKGTIWVYSELQKGSVFKVYLPLVLEAADQPVEQKAKIDSTLTNASILVIDDEPELRVLIHDILENHGYKVQMAANGAEALALIEKASHPFDLIVSDVMMPVMGGPALKEELEVRGIQSKLLFLSGYAEEALFDQHNQSGLQFLEKPFTSSSLLEKIRRSLS